MQRAYCVYFLFVLAWLSDCFAATPPPNDEFDSRTFLEGNLVRFSGTLAGATVRPLEPYAAGPTVWWSWTAMETAPVTIQVWNVQRPGAPFSTSDYSYFNVYSPSNLALGFPTNDWPVTAVARMVFLPDAPHPTLCFTGYAGKTYQFQLTGQTSADYEFSLTAANEPVILLHPETTTANDQGAVLFSVLAVGVLPMEYQWQKGGAVIAGADSPTLVFTNVSAGDAGAYSVMVSNATGVSTSRVAHLYVTPNASPPQLQSVGFTTANELSFLLTGEAGRHYRMESSTNLVDWVPESTLVSRCFFNSRPVSNSFVFASNGVAKLQVPANWQKKFVRAIRYAPSNEVCNVHLKQLRFLKNLWAVQTQKGPIDTPQDKELFMPYKTPKPRCPGGGFYTLGAVSAVPQCSISGHVLVEPQ